MLEFIIDLFLYESKEGLFVVFFGGGGIILFLDYCEDDFFYWFEWFYLDVEIIDIDRFISYDNILDFLLLESVLLVKEISFDGFFNFEE